MAKARWIARASVELRTKTLKMKGKGEAIQSWNRVHNRGTKKRIFFGMAPVGLRAPDSTSTTLSGGITAALPSFLSLPITWNPYLSIQPGGMQALQVRAIFPKHKAGDKPHR